MKLLQKNIFYTAAFLVIVLPSIYLPVTADNFLIKFFVLVTAVIWCVLYSLNKKIYWGGLGKLILVFAVFKTLSLLWAPNKSVGLDTLWRQLIIIAGGYFIGVNISDKDRSRILKFIVYGAVIPSVYGIFQMLSGNTYWQDSYSGRIGSLLGNPNFFSGYLLAVIPIAVLFIFAGSGKKRIFPITAAVVFVFCLIMSGTRSSMIALLFEFLILYLFIKSKILKTGIILLLLAGLSLNITSSALRERFIEGITFTSSSITQRIFKWRTAMLMLKDSPLLGQGVGGVKTNYAVYQAEIRKKFPMQLKGTSESQIHSEYLQVLAETGMIGFGIFLIILFYGLRNLIKQPREEYLFILTAILGVMVDSIASFPLYIIPTGFLFFMYMGMGDNKREFNFFSGKSGIVPGIILLLIYIKLSLAPLYADYLRLKADRLRALFPEEAHVLYSTAHRLSPVDGQAEYRHARLMFDMKNLGEAEKALKNSIKIRHYGEVYNNLAIVYYLTEKYSLALDTWEKVLEIGLPNPKDFENVKNNVRKLGRSNPTAN